MKIRFLANFLLLALFLVVSTNQAFAAGVPIPFRIGGTLTIDGVQKLQSDTGIVVKVTKPDGTAYTDASGNPAQATSLNASNWYLINVPIYDVTVQPGGANTNDSTVIHVILNGTELSVTSPVSGALTVGASGATQQINLTAVSQVNGSCGTADAKKFTIAPTTNLCTTGTESALTGTGPWNWSCNGSNGGTNANCSANIQTYTVTSAGDANGTVSCQSPVNYAANSVCTMTPATGYHIATLTDNGIDKFASVSANDYTINTVTANHAIAASFAINTSTVTGSGDANGTVTCQTPVNYSANSVCTITPATGYHLSSLIDNGIDKFASVSANKYTINTVTANHAVAATFAINTYTVTGSGDSNGTISCQTPVNFNTNSVCTITPATGYHLATMTDDGIDKFASVSSNDYTISSTQKNHTVVATFAINSYAVAPSAGTGGSITPATQQSVDHNGNASLTVTPDTGYSIVSVTGCGGTLTGNTYITGAITGACTLAATFQINSYAITTTVSGGNGTLSCTTPVNYGGNSTCTTTPTANYHLATFTDATVDKLAAVSGNNYTISNVQANHAVAATFAINTHTVTPSAGTNSSFTPAGVQTVNHGSTTSFTVTPAAGYGILKVEGCSGNLTGTTYNTGAITANCSVTVTSIARNGSVDGTTPATVTDALNALLAYVGKKTLTTEEKIRYDVAPLASNGIPQGNGAVDLADVILILRRTVGIGSW